MTKAPIGQSDIFERSDTRARLAFETDAYLMRFSSQWLATLPQLRARLSVRAGANTVEERNSP